MLDLIHKAYFYKLFLWDFERLVGISLGIEDHELVGQLQKVATSPVPTCNPSQQDNIVRHVKRCWSDQRLYPHQVTHTGSCKQANAANGT